MAAFSVSSQWRDFERDVREHREKVSKIAQEANVSLEKLQEIASTQQSLRDAIHSYQATIEGIGEKLAELSKPSNDMTEELSKALSASLSASTEIAEELKSLQPKLIEEVTKSVKKLIPEMVEDQLKDYGLKANTDNAEHKETLLNQPASS